MAYYKGQLVLHGHTFAIHARSRAKREDWRREEDGLNARESLELLVGDASHSFVLESGLDTWQKRLMYFLKPVAQHFETDSGMLLQGYMRHNLPAHMLEAGVDPMGFLEARA